MATAHPKRDIDPRTPFHEFPGPLLVSTARRFAELGVDEALAAAIRRQGSDEIVRRHLATMRVELLPESAERTVVRSTDTSRQRPRLLRGLYTPPEQQLANVRRWNTERSWGIPEEWFTTLGPAPAWPDGKLTCITLEVALPGLPEKDEKGNTIPAVPGHVRTVRELWDIISHQHPKAWELPELHLDAEHLFFLDGATYEPGLRWRVLDLGANWDKKDGIRPADVRNPLTSPNVDGFAAIAHHPQFVRRMDGSKVPYFWITGFQVTVPGDDPRRYVLIVRWNRDARQVDLHVRWGVHRFPNYSVPVRLGGGGPRA